MVMGACRVIETGRDGYAEMPAGLADGCEMLPAAITAMTGGHNTPLHPEPVYVDGDNSLVYNSKMMETGRRYRITWCGEHFVLVKGAEGVEVYRFDPA